MKDLEARFAMGFRMAAYIREQLAEVYALPYGSEKAGRSLGLAEIGIRELEAVLGIKPEPKPEDAA